MKNNRCGRTWRDRRKYRNAIHVIDHEPFIVNLRQWLCSHSSYTYLGKMKLMTSSSGRNFVSKKNISAGDVLLCIPKAAILSCDHVFNDPELKDALKKTKIVLRCEEALTLLLTYHKKNPLRSSPWQPYLNSLPLNFCTPVCCLTEEVAALPSFIKELYIEQYCSIERCYNKLKDVLSLLNIHVTFSDISWAWLTVITRAVYEGNNDSRHHLVGNAHCILVPYLDLLNHSSSAVTSAYMNSKNNCFEIKTEMAIRKHEEIFINYGPHSNIKLYHYYGFILPHNPHNYIPLNVNFIIETILDDFVLAVHEKKKSIIFENLFNVNASVSSFGPSWNLQIMLFILLMDGKDLPHWKIVYHDNSVIQSKLVKKCIEKICSKLLDEYLVSLEKMKNMKLGSESLKVAQCLTEECCAILKLVPNIDF